MRYGPGRRLRVTSEDGVPVARPRVFLQAAARPEVAANRYRRACELAWRRLDREKPDLVHAHITQPSGWAALKLAGELGVPCVITEHSGPFDPDSISAEARQLMREALEGADRCVAVSPHLASSIEEFSGRSVEVVGNIVDVDPPVRREQDGFHISFVGLMTPVKGVDVLLRAMAELRSEEWRLQLGGDGPHRTELQALARTLGISDRCDWLGLLDRDGVHRTLSRSDLIVVSSRHESFGLVAAEALALERPLIASNVGGLPFVTAGTDAVIVPPDDPDALAQAVGRTIRGETTFDGQAARASVLKRFGPEAILDRLSGVYEDVLAA
jgi:glycosyltransferase involved in cell wall biosynthesis